MAEAASTPTGAGASWSFTKMLEDPNFQLMLANMGKAADPEGAGGVIGGAAANMISSKAAQTAIEKRDAARQKQIQQLIYLHGGVTAPDKPGINSIKATPAGSFALDLNLPEPDAPVGTGTVLAPPPERTQPLVAPTATTGTVAAPTAAAPTATPVRTAARRQPDITDISPFLLSPGGFEGGSLAGLNPEQIAQMGRLDTEREALRLRSVSELIQARNIQSEIAYRETSGALNRQQAANLLAIEPHLAAEMLAKIDSQRESAGASRATRIREETLLPIQVEQERAQTKEIEARTKRVNELLDYEKRNIDANIKQSMASAGSLNASADRARLLAPKEAALLDKQNAEYVQMQIDGKQFTGKAMDLLKERNDNIKLIARLAKEHQDKIANARKDQRSELNMATAAERNIEAKKPGGFKEGLSNSWDESQLAPDIDEFHATSKKPYVYILEDNSTRFASGTKVVKRDLPTVDGHRYTAQELYDAASARSMTVQQYMEQVFYPMLKQPVPWKPAASK